MKADDLSGAAWRKSSYSGINGCIEVARHPLGRVVWLRDSHDPQSLLVVSVTDWRVFVDGVKAGEFDDLSA